MLRKWDLKAGVLPLWKSNRPQGSLPTLDTTSLWSGVTCPLRMFVLLWKAALYREDSQQMGRGGAEVGGQRVSSLFFKSLVILLKKKYKTSKPPNKSINVTEVTFSDRFSFFFFVCLSWWCGSCNNLLPLMILASFPRPLSSHSLMLFWTMIPGSLVTIVSRSPVTWH